MTSKTTTDLHNLPQRFIYARTVLNQQLSQAKLAKALGVSQQSIEKLENGHVKKPKYLPEAAAQMGVSYLWLLTGRPPIQETASNPHIQKYKDLMEEDRQHVNFMIDAYYEKIASKSNHLTEKTEKKSKKPL